MPGVDIMREKSVLGLSPSCCTERILYLRLWRRLEEKVVSCLFLLAPFRTPKRDAWRQSAIPTTPLQH